MTSYFSLSFTKNFYTYAVLSNNIVGKSIGIINITDIKTRIENQFLCSNILTDNFSLLPKAIKCDKNSVFGCPNE